MILDERYALWSHYGISSLSDVVILDGAGTEIARFDRFNPQQIANALT
ncbi:MAG: hypothetical protein GY708_28590 [Actinomycetia bacterium]|nr:hypothetical protein [Actinomycetes bacterium]MCP5031807.1 hypothetical protein [Actinomycetes bacterium]